MTPSLPDRIARSAGNSLSWLFLVAVLLTVYEVVLRYAFNSPTVWVHDTVIALTALCFIAGGALASADRAHIQVASFSDRVSASTRRRMAFACEVLTIVYFVCFAYAAWRQAAPAIELMETSGHAWDVPIPAFLKTMLLAGVVLMLAIAVVHLWRGWRGQMDLSKPNQETIV